MGNAACGSSQPTTEIKINAAHRNYVSHGKLVTRPEYEENKRSFFREEGGKVLRTCHNVGRTNM